jgi:hypothetical protein
VGNGGDRGRVALCTGRRKGEPRFEPSSHGNTRAPYRDDLPARLLPSRFTELHRQYEREHRKYHGRGTPNSDGNTGGAQAGRRSERSKG